jgi:hypothetical protein
LVFLKRKEKMTDFIEVYCPGGVWHDFESIGSYEGRYSYRNIRLEL